MTPTAPEPERSRSDIRLSNETWESVMTAHANLVAEFSAEPMWTDASMREYDVLYTLTKADGPQRIGDLQGAVLLSQPALSRLVDRLVQRGLVAREPDPEDGRAVRIRLTDEGRRVQREIGRAHSKSVDRALGSALSTTEMRELQRLCRKLVARSTTHDLSEKN